MKTKLLTYSGQGETSITRHIMHWKKIQAGILKKTGALPSRPFKYHRFKPGPSKRLFVLLTGIPPIGHFENPDFFEWGRFALEYLGRHNCLFLRDSNNNWFLHPSDATSQRSDVVEFIESVRRSLVIDKRNVTVVGCSAGATAALDLVSLAQYGKAISFSSQLDFKEDLRLLETLNESFRPRYEMQKKILRSGHYPSLLPSLLLSDPQSHFYLFWGTRNTVDNNLHIDFFAKLQAKKNFHFIPLNTDEHNTAAVCDRTAIKNLFLQ
jgi:pimeloyl-ACP methyl ester carboxylesterase